MKDHDRPLNPRGIRDAPIMATKLAAISERIDVSLVSSAIRAQETAAYFHQAVDYKEKLSINKIYHASVDTLIDVIMQIDDEYDSAMMVGHNPGFTFLHNSFADELIDNLPTCGLFCLDIKADRWQDVDATNTFVSMLIYPKMF